MHKPLYKPLFEQAICKQCPPPWEAARGCWTSFRGRRQGGRVLDRAAGAEPHGLAKQGGPQQGGRTSSCFPCAPGRGLRAGRQREAPAARLADRVAFIQHRFALRAADFRFRQLRPALPAVHARVAHGRPFPFPSKAASSDRACVGHVSTQCDDSAGTRSLKIGERQARPKPRRRQQAPNLHAAQASLRRQRPLGRPAPSAPDRMHLQPGG